ncbi:MAG: zinc ribbon domain-containing protein [Planctomycetes bacterium]|nr:zinc ribbon domain-containing protein [Planctomycetota bacterium]
MSKKRIGGLWVVALLASSGCVCFPGRELPEVPRESVMGLNVPGGVVVDAAYSIVGQPHALPNEELRLGVEQALGGPPRPGMLGTRVVLNLQHDMHQGGMVLAIVVSELSVMLIPVTLGNDFRLTADVTTLDGQRRSYVLKDSMRSWFQMFLVFFMSSRRMPSKVQRDVIENMANNLLAQMERDGIATRGGVAPGSPPGGATPGGTPPPTAGGACSYCGQKVDPTAPNCPGCGAPLR